MLHELKAIEDEALPLLEACTSKEEVDRWLRDYLGRNGQLTALLRKLGSLPDDERPGVGKLANQAKAMLEDAWDRKRQGLAPVARDNGLDVTLPGRPTPIGRLHPISATIRQMGAAFRRMGFQVFAAPDVETEAHNFGLLNFPPHHPARDSYDTFWSARPDILLRTHTSAAQVWLMQQLDLPIRAVVPGACYRHDQPDASHNVMFYQMEGFAVGTGIHLTDLFGAISGLARLLFGEDSQIRFRGHYFPFTEPSIEADLRCTVCHGRGCRLCKGSGWVEVIPGGMIHPAVLRNGGIDAARYGGFAFGAGIDRIAALLYRLPDIRMLYENDLRFLEQY